MPLILQKEVYYEKDYYFIGGDTIYCGLFFNRQLPETFEYTVPAEPNMTISKALDGIRRHIAGVSSSVTTRINEDPIISRCISVQTLHNLCARIVNVVGMMNQVAKIQDQGNLVIVQWLNKQAHVP